MTEKEANEKFGSENVTVYESKFTPLYHSMTSRKPQTVMKLVCQGAEERVVPGGVEIVVATQRAWNGRFLRSGGSETNADSRDVLSL